MFWFHGLGLSLCAARGRVSWGGDNADYDAVECISFCFMPIVPLRVVHVSHGRNPLHPVDIDIRQYPIRWSMGVVVRAFAARWLWGIFALASLVLIAMLGAGRPGQRIAALVVAAILFSIFSGGRWLLRRVDRRHREIRLLLGRHHFGSSDPVSWRESRFNGGSNPEAVFGTSSYADAVPLLLAAGEYSRAMWAARLTAAREDPRIGEELTTAILNEPEVREALTQIEQNPRVWHRLMVGEA